MFSNRITNSLPQKQNESLNQFERAVMFNITADSALQNRYVFMIPKLTDTSLH